MRKLYLCIAIFFVGCWSHAQDCGCDYFISTETITFDGSDVLPGEVICLESGSRPRLKLKNIEGTSTDPVRIINCGGLVEINSAFNPFALRVEHCDFIQLTGTGDELLPHGIRVSSSGGPGIIVGNLSNHFEVDHIEIENTDGPAFICRENPVCDLSANEGYFTLENVRLHNLLISNCRKGIQMGHPRFRFGYPHPFCGVLNPYAIENLFISDVQITSITEGDGILLHGCTGEISNSHIEHVSGVGVLLGMECDMLLNQNYIAFCTRNGLKSSGSGIQQVFNNVFYANGGLENASVWFEFFMPEGGADHENSLDFKQNTVVASGDYNVVVKYSENATSDCYIQNNIFCEPNEAILGEYPHAPYLYVAPSDLFHISHNSSTTDRADQIFAGFDDFHLTHASPAVNLGLENELLYDFTGGYRNLAGLPDAGAYEYEPESLAYFERIPLVGLYVDNFKNILGNPEAETTLLEYAKTNGFNYLLLYNLSYIHTHSYDLTDPSEAIVLANFIERAKKDYGIAQVGAVGEKDASFVKIQAFNELFGDSWFRRFDVLNLEFEFWTDPLSAVFSYYCENYLAPGGYPCSNLGAYSFYSDELEDIDERAHDMGIISEIYLGYPSDEEAIGLAERSDRILLHHYRTTDTYGDGSSIYNYHTNRIRAIALSDRKPAVMPIFSSRAYHMGPWLLGHSLHQPMETWLHGTEGYYEDTSPGVSELPISGFQWYRYTSFLDLLPDLYSPLEHPVELDHDAFQVNVTHQQSANQLAVVVGVDELPHPMNCNLYSLQGELIGSYSLSGGSNAVSLETVSSGVYLCVIESEQERVWLTQKIVQP